MALYLYVRRSPTGRRLITTGRFTPYENQRLTRADMIFTWGGDVLATRFELNGAKRLNPYVHDDKLGQHNRYVRANISVPKRYESETSWAADGYPALIKKPRHGQGGRGIVLCSRGNLPGFRPENIYQLYIEKEREFRVAQIGELSAYLMEKLPPDSNGICWNLDQGAEWRGVPAEEGTLRRQLTSMAKDVLLAMEYDIGAVDIMKKDRSLYVLECNSRPGLGPENISRFADTIVRFYENWRRPR